MKIAIDLTELRTSKMGGIEVYCRDLLKDFSVNSRGNEYAVFVPEDEVRNVHYDGLKLVKYKDKSFGKIARISHKLYEQLAYKGLIQRYRPDLIHVPFQVVRHRIHGVPIVLSIMDIQHEYFPEYFTKQDLQARGLLFESSAKAAQQIIAISKFTKSTIIEKYGISPHKISVVHLSHDEALFYPRKDKKKSLRLPKKFLFYPAATWPHKNHIALIEALSKYIQQSKDKQMNVVFAGIPKQQGKKIRDAIKKHRLEDNVHWLGYLDRVELPYVYCAALAVIFPSKFEGFGIPILEAMACGCPVACSNTTSLPEVAGKAALFFDPDSIQEISETISTLATNAGVRTDLRKLGLKRVKNFSRKKVADQTIEVYKGVLAS